jgi:hypothetical protein
VRRRFLKSLAAAPLAVVQPPAPTPSPPPSAPPPPEPRAAELLTDLVRARFGEHLDAAALEDVKKGIEGALQSAARLRQVPLGNADEPPTTFEARPRRPAARRPR